MSSELSPLSPEDVKPGVLHTLLSKFAGKAEPQKTFKICIDGKKINSTITAKHGDIDLWGNEARPTLQERQADLRDDKSLIETCSRQVIKLIDFHKSDFTDLTTDNKTFLTKLLRQLITALSLRVKTLRETVLQEERTKTDL